MSVGAVSGFGAGISVWPSLAYLEAQLLRDQQQLWAHQRAAAGQSVINADLLAIQRDKMAINSNNLRSMQTQAAAQNPATTSAAAFSATQAKVSAQAGLLAAAQNSKLTRLVGTKITNQASYLIPASFASNANNQSALWQWFDLYL